VTLRRDLLASYPSQEQKINGSNPARVQGDRGFLIAVPMFESLFALLVCGNNCHIKSLKLIFEL
jgi:hypothetical protein